MTDTIICTESTKAGDILTTPEGAIVTATSHAQSVGDGYMAHVRPISTVDEFKSLMVAQGIVDVGDTPFAIMRKLWAAYWKLKAAQTAKKSSPKSIRGAFASPPQDTSALSATDG